MQAHHWLLPLFCCALLLPTATRADAINDLLLETPIPTVLTPVRLKQPRTEVPASVTVIDRQLIEASGLRQLAEIFRLVPGTSVGARDGWNYVVSYHGTTYRDSRRMQVMVDGRSVYQAGLATIDWNDIPLAVEDIERIEIVRGPDTAAYGANAFLGVINIVTQHPDDSPALRLKASNGSGNTEDYYASTSGALGSSRYRITANGRRDAGFDKNAAGNDRRDSTNLQLINGRWELMPTETWKLSLNAGYKYGQYTDDFSEGDVTSPDHLVRDWFGSATAEHYFTARNSVKLQLDVAGQHKDTAWRTCIAAADIGIPIPTSLCGNINENGTNQRTDFDIQDTLIGELPWKLVTGAHVQHQVVNSATYYGGSVDRSTYQLFANYEYRFLPQWSATIAGSEEYTDTIGEDFSPRVALLYFPSENHSLRAVYSEAIRAPDLFETKADWSYTATNVQPNFLGSTLEIPLNAVADGTLREENIRSREIGYYGLWLNRRLQTDVKWFWDDLYNLSLSSLTLSSFNPANKESVKQQGFETEINFHATDYLRLRATYALINSNTDPNFARRMRTFDFTPKNSGSLTMILDLPEQWQLSSNYYYANEINSSKFSRGDVRLQKSIGIPSGRLQLSANLKHDFSEQGDLFMDNLYNSPNRLLFTVDLIF